jgi:hypothetical protein
MKTAVEWLFEQLDISQGYESAIKILEQAKEMEKEQMESAYLAGESKDKQYYNETFKSE